MDDKDLQTKIELLGNNLLKIRKQKNLSQQELSFRTGIEKPYIRQIEKGRTNPTVKTLLKLASALETDIQNLFENTTNL